jgi:hypothetical protein
VCRFACNGVHILILPYPVPMPGLSTKASAFRKLWTVPRGPEWWCDRSMQKLTDALAARFASPTRSTRLTVVLGRWLALSFTVCFLTGLFSHGLQEPPSWMVFPSRPVWIYQLTQGVHVTAGLAAIPLLLAKLWSVYPELLKWPPVKSVGQALERGSIALFIASSLIELTTGLINTYKWYPWPFPFRETHYWLSWLSWVIWGSLLLHIAVKLPAPFRRTGVHALPRNRDSPTAEGNARSPHPGAGRAGRSSPQWGVRPVRWSSRQQASHGPGWTR